MALDETTEFDGFDGLQSKLVTVFLTDGYPRREAEAAGFLFAQAIRDVPPLLHLLGEAERHTPDKIMDAVHMVLSNRHALREAADILLHNEQLPQPE